MKIIYNNILPLRGFSAINLFGFVFVRKEFKPIYEITIRHEAIHTVQMRELLYILFYIWYVLEWLFRLIQYEDSKEAYRNISFEREAYEKQDDTGYLKNRGFFAAFKYLNNK